jgi:hypothetical protein
MSLDMWCLWHDGLLSTSAKEPHLNLIPRSARDSPAFTLPSIGGTPASNLRGDGLFCHNFQALLPETGGAVTEDVST